MPKRKVKEEKPKKRLGKKELLIAPIAMGAATLLALVVIPLVAPPPDPTGVCLKAHNIETFQLFPTIQVIVDGQPKLLPDGVVKEPKDGKDCLRPIHTDEMGNTVHIEYIRPIRFTTPDFMRIYSFDGLTITVHDNSTLEKQVLTLDNYNIQYSYYSETDFVKVDDLSKFPPFTNEMLARIELTSK